MNPNPIATLLEDISQILAAESEELAQDAAARYAIATAAVTRGPIPCDFLVSTETGTEIGFLVAAFWHDAETPDW